MSRYGREGSGGAPISGYNGPEKYAAERTAYRSGVTPSTVYSMLDGRRREVTINLIKKLCDGLDMTLGDFFSAPVFDELEQEIK